MTSAGATAASTATSRFGSDLASLSTPACLHPDFGHGIQGSERNTATLDTALGAHPRRPLSSPRGVAKRSFACCPTARRRSFAAARGAVRGRAARPLLLLIRLLHTPHFLVLGFQVGVSLPRIMCTERCDVGVTQWGLVDTGVGLGAVVVGTRRH